MLSSEMVDGNCQLCCSKMVVNLVEIIISTLNSVAKFKNVYLGVMEPIYINVLMWDQEGYP